MRETVECILADMAEEIREVETLPGSTATFASLLEELKANIIPSERDEVKSRLRKMSHGLDEKVKAIDAAWKH